MMVVFTVEQKFHRTALLLKLTQMLALKGLSGRADSERRRERNKSKKREKSQSSTVLGL